MDKQCKRCYQWLPLSEFKQQKNNLSKTCKNCLQKESQRLRALRCIHCMTRYECDVCHDIFF